MPLMPLNENMSAGVIARFLKSQGVDRIFSLCGGHIMPIWMRADAEGIQIIDVRDERAAIYMAHAHSELTGKLGVALVTAGPGVTNAMTGIANAHVARASILVLSGLPPRPQENRGALQDIAHTDLLKSITRYARTVRQSSLVLQELDEAVSRAMGAGGEPGPVYLDFPTDVLREEVPKPIQMLEHFRPKIVRPLLPHADDVSAAIKILWGAKKPLVISGRGARGAQKELCEFLDKLGAAYLDTGESKGLVPDSHPSVVAAMRGKVMGDADVIVTLGRRLDFQLAYGSPAVFGSARFVRIGDVPTEVRDNRRGDVEIHANPAKTLEAINQCVGTQASSVDREWVKSLRLKHEERAQRLAESMLIAPSDEQGRIHPNRVLAELQKQMGKDSIVVADGGDFLAFARVGLSVGTYLDPGSLGCIGIGTAFGIAASLACPGKDVVVATGDGAFGFNAMEVDTAVRHKAPVLIVVANNGAWQIEVHDQTDTHGKVVGTKLQVSDYAQMAQAFGMYAERVTSADDLEGALKRAMQNRPALLDVLVTPEAKSSDAKTGLAWVPDLQALAAWDDAERAWRED
jgi:acetolactate synthase-1/2/3 large subunit